MRKLNIIISIVSISFLLVSCTTSKEARTYRKQIDGNWQLQSVNTEGIMGKIKVELFNEALFNCFVGSTWSFNKIKSLGTYSIYKSGNECNAVKRNFRWTIFEAHGEPKLFQFKRLDNKLNIMDEGNGFRFTIALLDKTNMQLKSNIVFENKPAVIIYNFIKN